MSSIPFFSIIIPVYNGAQTLSRCLKSVQASQFQDWELFVVDDGSTDESAALAQRYGTRLLATNGRTGPAAARNLAAQHAHGRYLFFTDADCQLHPDTLSQAAAVLQQNPQLDALIGSYDDEPAEPNFVSQYKNLLHHFTHQTSDPHAQTFWTGCGAIKRQRFLELGGFDSQRYPRPSIEDIELGYRLTKAGGRIRLAPQVQIKHLKQWTLATLLHSDIFDRAVPWSQLLLTRTHIPPDLNLKIQNRLSAVLLFKAILLFCLKLSGFFHQRPFWRPLALIALLLLWLNRALYLFFYHKRGCWFVLFTIPLHWLYYGYSSAIFVQQFVHNLLQDINKS